MILRREEIEASIESWSKGYSRSAHVARARYLLSLVLEAEGKDSEATRYKEQAESVLHELTKSHAASEIGIDMKAYYSLVTVWNGRSFISIRRVKKEDDL